MKTTTTAIAIAADAIVQIPLADLHESPFNPRQVFDEAGLLELAASIRGEGRIHQPLLVRPIVPPMFKGDPNGQAGFEIVFGHRRSRAARLAELVTVPCMVRDMTDDQARRAQIAENLQRVDVHPIEEAEGFQALIDNHNETADRIADQFGKSRSYVYGRLKLLQAVPEIRKACLAGEIGAEVALLIARLGSEKLQAKALGYIRGKYLDLQDGGAQSFRRVRDLLNERFTLQLKSALFDVEDEMLLPSAGHCIRCPKRSGNAPEFLDVAEPAKTKDYRRSGALRHTGADVCTDPDCFDAKKKAHLARAAAVLTDKGLAVVVGNAARQAISATGEIKGAYIPLAQVKDALKKAGAQVSVVIIQDPRGGKTHKAVKLEDVKAAGVKVAAPKPSGQRYDYEADRRKREELEKVNQVKADAATRVNLEIWRRVREAGLARERDTQDLQLAAAACWRAVDYEDQETVAKVYGEKSRDAIAKMIGQADRVALELFILTCATVKDVVLSAWDVARDVRPEALLQTAKRYGVDVAIVRREMLEPAPAQAGIESMLKPDRYISPTQKKKAARAAKAAAATDKAEA